MSTATTSSPTAGSQWVTPLAASLQKAGVATADIASLESEWANADPQAFVAGLSWIARCYLELQIPTTGQPTDEPWSRIAAALAGVSGGDIEETILAQIATFPPILHTSLYSAIVSRSGMIQAEQARQASRKRKAKVAEYVGVLADLGYSFRLNVLSDTIEVNEKPISDPLAATIRGEMRDAGYDSVFAMEDAYLSEAFKHKFHPVTNYLDSLAYDGGQYIASLAQYFQDRDGVFSIWLRKWLIGAVAKARAAEQNAVLVLQGAQRIGKSHFVKWLASGLPGMHIEGPIDTDDKDAQVRLCSTWIWEVSELGATTRKSDRESLKHFLTMRTVTVRRAYGRHDMIKPALASFIGTVNNEAGFLTDPTGNRRFNAVDLINIDWSYATVLDVNSVWAEANAAYLSGEQWMLSDDERDIAARINEGFEVEDPVEGMLQKHFHIDPTNTHIWTASVDIVLELENRGLRGGSTRANCMALASVATKLGLAKTKMTNQRGQRVWGYRGIEPL